MTLGNYLFVFTIYIITVKGVVVLFTPHSVILLLFCDFKNSGKGKYKQYIHTTVFL